MVKLLAALIFVFYTVSIVRADGDKELRDNKDIQVIGLDTYLQWMCDNVPIVAQSEVCNSRTTTTTTTVASSTTTTQVPIDDLDNSNVDTSSAKPLSTLELAHWCRFSNGTYLPYAFTFMLNECALCQCIDSRAIRCANLQCMTSYCIDGSTPYRKTGQCCSQCAYENVSTSCVFKGITIPHGTVLGQTKEGAQCWCQSGIIECRKGKIALFSGLDYWGNGTAVYVVVIVICIMLIIGTLLCCGVGGLYYYYYQQNQQTVQEAYAQYYNNAGWQPVAEDGTVVIDNQNAEKQAEAEKQQFGFEHSTGNSEQYIPPPYALYNGSYVQEKDETKQ